jgi:hypothetical protein
VAKKYEYIESYTDRNGIKRIYGYDKNGLKYLVNVREVLRIYKERGLDGFEVVA